MKKNQIKHIYENAKLMTALKKINVYASTHSAIDTMAKALTTLDMNIVGYAYKIELNIAYCSVMIIRPILNDRSGYAFEIYMGSDYIQVREETRLGSGKFTTDEINLHR